MANRSKNSLSDDFKQDLMRLKRSLRKKGNGMMAYLRKNLAELLHRKDDSRRVKK